MEQWVQLKRPSGVSGAMSPRILGPETEAIYVCVCVYIYIYIYICIERERERERIQLEFKIKIQFYAMCLNLYGITP